MISNNPLGSLSIVSELTKEPGNRRPGSGRHLLPSLNRTFRVMVCISTCIYIFLQIPPPPAGGFNARPNIKRQDTSDLPSPGPELGPIYSSVTILRPFISLRAEPVEDLRA
ncbi:uncharacterized protein BDV17DRAFT_181958 [Aspergillus undulatus]|uniref:uncharacterized protein n=1 Tax=Aspergillus undulatus TaxID=1810928 RepID=UPI003CCE1115